MVTHAGLVGVEGNLRYITVCMSFIGRVTASWPGVGGSTGLQVSERASLADITFTGNMVGALRENAFYGPQFPSD